MNNVDNYQAFWNWFNEHEQMLFNFELDHERVFDQLANELKKIDPDLTFEFGPKAARREFVISAGGIKRAFSSVSALALAAPRLNRWFVTAFRPRRSLSSVVEFRGKTVNTKDVQFSLLDNGKIAGLYLYIPGFRDDDQDLMQIGYLMLDEALGEYDVELRLGLIKILSPEAKTEFNRYPLLELPWRFDQLNSQLGREHQA